MFTWKNRETKTMRIFSPTTSSSRCITFRNVFPCDTFARIAFVQLYHKSKLLPERENNPAAKDLAWFTLIKALLVYLPLYSGHYLKSFVWDTFGLKTWTVFNLQPVINDLWLGRPSRWYELLNFDAARKIDRKRTYNERFLFTFFT